MEKLDCEGRRAVFSDRPRAGWVLHSAEKEGDTSRGAEKSD